MTVTGSRGGGGGDEETVDTDDDDDDGCKGSSFPDCWGRNSFGGDMYDGVDVCDDSNADVDANDPGDCTPPLSPCLSLCSLM